jgi:glycerol-3-phosphate acyltransferase PlsY
MSIVESLFPVVAYVAGAIPFGLLVGMAKGVDLRTIGSGNIGATNVARNLGMRWGLAVLLLDALKGLLPVLAARLILADRPFAAMVMALTMVAAVVGHMFTIFLLFRGGKGVATALGVLLAAAPLAGLVSGILYVGTYATLRISSLGSMALTISAPIMLLVLGAPPEVLAATLVIALLIVIKHIPNLKRLVRGEEGRV